MAEHTVTFIEPSKTISVPTGALIVEAAQQAGVEISQPCGGQGRCGRCAVRVVEGTVRSRSTLRLTVEDIANQYVLGCQAVIEGDVSIDVPPQELIERRLTTDRTVAKIQVPSGYTPQSAQTIHRCVVSLSEPSMLDQTDDWSRLQAVLGQKIGTEHPGFSADQISISLPLLRILGDVLRQGEWTVTVVYEIRGWDQPENQVQILDILPTATPGDEPLWGVAIDIGTTTVSVWMVNLLTGEVEAQVAEYNQQVVRGEDVISRIIYASKDKGLPEMQNLVVGTINGPGRTGV